MINANQIIKDNLEINDFLTDVKSITKSKNELFFCQKLDLSINKYDFQDFPYKNNFHYVGLVKIDNIEIDKNRNEILSTQYFLIFQNPNVVFRCPKNKWF